MEMESRAILGWLTNGSSPRNPYKRYTKARVSTHCYVGCSLELSYSGNNGRVENPKVFSFQSGCWKVIGSGIAPRNCQNPHRVGLAEKTKFPWHLIVLFQI